jgi:hypothetical protein
MGRHIVIAIKSGSKILAHLHVFRNPKDKKNLVFGIPSLCVYVCMHVCVPPLAPEKLDVFYLYLGFSSVPNNRTIVFPKIEVLHEVPQTQISYVYIIENISGDFD